METAPEVKPKNNWLAALPVTALLTLSTALVIAVGIWADQDFSAVSLRFDLPEGKVDLSLGTQPFKLEATDQWINCNMARNSLVEEGGRLYIGCDGGLLVITPDGEVIDQYSMADGLKNNFINSVVKRGDTLYLGTQDGFSIVNLLDRSIKNISIDQGLQNAANVILALDRDWLWVGTFDGVSRYNLQTEQLENFHDQFSSVGSQLNTSDIVVTDKAVYLVFNTHAYSAGGIIRYDKNSDTFEIISRGKFDKSRLEILDLISYDGVILVSDWRDMWIAPDSPDANWEHHSGIQERVGQMIGQEHPVLKFVGFRNGQPLILADNRLFAYHLETREISQLYPATQTEGVNYLEQTTLVSSKSDSVWFNKVSGFNLLRLNLEDLSFRQTQLQDRPATFDYLLGLVNGQPIFLGNGNQIWELGNRGFQKLFEFKTSGGIEPNSQGLAFAPLANSDRIFIYYQTCGQGCSKPEAYVMNYPDRSFRQIEIAGQVMEAVGTEFEGNWSYANMLFVGIDNGVAQFEVPRPDGYLLARYDVTADSWSLANMGGQSQDAATIRCNAVYSLSNGRFDQYHCPKETDQHRWEISEPHGRSTLTQVSLDTGERTQLEPVLTAKRYTPFKAGDFYIPSFNHGVIIADQFWLATNLGLTTFDPVSGSWNLYDTGRGLVTNEIINFAVGEDVLWVITGFGGGLAGIKLP